MFSWICRRFTYANVAMTLALVFVMTGGAYAAKHYLITSTKQISPKVLRALTGKAGPAGLQGPIGPQGPAGPAGAKGENGAAGGEGKEGKAGVSVTSKPLPEGDEKCKAGGSEFKTGSSTPAYACNGSPWVVGGLPKGATEEGVWSVAALPIKSAAGEVVTAAISFTVPLAAPLAETKVHVIAAGTPGTSDPAGCKGTIASPEAESENLCIFEHEPSQNVGGISVFSPETSELGAGKAGTTLLISPTTKEERIFAVGVWVVTG